VRAGVRCTTTAHHPAAACLATSSAAPQPEDSIHLTDHSIHLTTAGKEPTRMIHCPCQVLYSSKSMSRPRRCWRSREFGFVDFDSQEQATLALATFSGMYLPGVSKGSLPLRVQYGRDADAGAFSGDWPSVHWSAGVPA
jgi:hypothetical protein